MKNYTKKLFILIALILAFAGLASAQQNLLVQTTLTAAIPVTPSSLFSSSATTVQVASATGIQALQLNPTQTLNIQNQWVIYVDREMMLVTGINGTTLFVTRGYFSTLAAPHASGAMVLYGRANWFYSTDPGGAPSWGTGVSGVSCTAASVFVTPYVNVRTGAQWICSTITGTWVPGFNNPLYPMGAIVTTAVASAAGVILPSGPLFHVTGALAVTGFTIPVGCNATVVGGCAFTIIPDGTFTWTAAGNIALAGTAVVNKALTFIWDAKNSKWVPSYIA